MKIKRPASTLAISTEKQVLKMKLNALILKETEELIEANFPIFKRKYLGRYFKTWNSYGGSRGKGWNIYSRVIELKPENIYDTSGNGVTSTCKVWRFQVDCYGDISIDLSHGTYVHSIGKEISKEEFTKEWSKAKLKIKKLE